MKEFGVRSPASDENHHAAKHFGSGYEAPPCSCVSPGVVHDRGLSVAADRAGPQRWRCDADCVGFAAVMGDRDLDWACGRMVSWCRPGGAVRLCVGGVGYEAVVVGAAGGVAQQGVGGQHLA